MKERKIMEGEGGNSATSANFYTHSVTSLILVRQRKHETFDLSAHAHTSSNNFHGERKPKIKDQRATNTSRLFPLIMYCLTTVDRKESHVCEVNNSISLLSVKLAILFLLAFPT
jgi:hypothetical protein